MKIKILVCFLAATLFTAVQSTERNASAQTVGQPFAGAYGGGQVYEPGTFQPVVGDLQTGMPGRIWVGAQLADQGLGYQGSYATIGAKRRIFEDALDGRWLVEGRAHHSINGEGGFFANLGIERVFSIDAAEAEVSMGLWYDYDSDQQGTFAHTFNQIGVTAQIKTRRWDLIGNGYFPEGTTSHTQGDPTGEDCFFGNSIIVIPGIDSALKGFDATLRLRPQQLAFANGTLDIGGYAYESDLIDFFAGGRARLGFQAMKGMIVNAEVTYDERFDITGSLGVAWIYGVNARGNEYAGIGRDMERTLRNDHITRFQQDVVLALDPDTGRPYNVYHVDNTADASVETGASETPFTTLAAAEAASGAGDIVFVRPGDGTARGMRDGIVLEDDQFLLGGGAGNVIPIQDGLNFVLCGDMDGRRPTIAGSNNGAAVTLANNNVVSGLNIDGSQGVGGMAHGINGDGILRGEPLTNGVIRDNVITNAILNGINLDTIDGDWTFERNETTDNGFNGISVVNACDPSSILIFEENVSSDNGQDGIHLRNYDAESLVFLRNITEDNGRDGLRLENFKNTNGNGLVLDLTGATSTGNNGFGINIIGGEGNLSVLNGDITGNIGGGLSITDWTNTDPNTRTFIGTTVGGLSNYSNNAPGIGINVVLNGGIQRVVITDSTVDGNGYGIVARASGIGTTLISQIVDNRSVSNNLVDGIRVIAENGASHQTLIDEQSPDGVERLPIRNNGGNGIVFFAGSSAGGVVSEIDAIVRNMDITGNNDGHGIFGDINEDGSLQLMVSDSNIDQNGLDGMSFRLNGNENGLVNRILATRLTMLDNGDDGIDLISFAGTFTDFQITDSVLDSTATIAANGDTNGVRLGGTGIGINLVQVGDNSLTNPQADGRLRAFIQGNTILEFAQQGINVSAFGDGQVVAQIEGNFLDQNGYGETNTNDFVGPPDEVPNLPQNPGDRVYEGILVTAFNDSSIALRLNENDINRSTDFGLKVATEDNGNVDAILIGNDFSDNDYGDDPDDQDPGRTDDGIDFVFDNGGSGTMCIAMSNNYFSTIGDIGHPFLGFVHDQFGFINTTGGFALYNASAQADMVFELDGNTNFWGPGDVVLNPPFFNGATFSTFGSACEGNVQAAEAAFLADGFPPIP